MAEHYAAIKLLHITCVLLSGVFFVGRGGLMLAGNPLYGHPAVKGVTYLNDSMLLLAGLTLMNITAQFPLTHPWLAMKLLLLVFYILFGLIALRLAEQLRTKLIFLGLALATYLFMISIARGHHPLGIFVTHRLY
ncbi:MAG: SirB2 family protein [Gammaproteobacteria bacterium]|nr:SirB2 family protein [Gammaproteobacteria bacterium]